MADEVAKLADKLRAKKGEKMAVGKEIKEAQDYLDEGFVGRLTMSLSCDGGHAVSKIEYSPSQDSQSSPVTMEKNLGGEAAFLLKGKKGSIAISVTTVEDSGDMVVYNFSLDCAIVPNESYVKSDIEGLSDTGRSLTCSVKASFSPLESFMASKAIEIKQLDQECAELTTLMHKPQRGPPPAPSPSQPSATKDKRTKKQVQFPAQGDNEVPANAVAKKGINFSEILAIATSSCIALAGKSFENRSYFIFAAAVAGIAYYGEYASV